MFRFFVVLLALVSYAAPALAIGIDVKKIPRVANYEADDAQFQKRSKKILEPQPYDEELMGYEFYVPKNWTNNIQAAPVTSDATGMELSETVLGILGRYIGPPTNLMRSNVVVEGQGMAYEVSAMNWFINFILLNGFSLTAITEKSSREVEALYVQVDKDMTFVVRTRVIINGNRLVMIRYYLPQENYEAEKVQQAQVVTSFRLAKPTEERIEKQDQYGFLDQSYFSYPSSWKLKEKSILSIERMSALLYQERKDGKESVLEGHIKINAISRLLKTTLAQEIAEFRKNLKIKDYSVGDLIENVEYKYDPTVKSGKAQIYKLVPVDTVNMKSYEFLVTVMQGDDYYYITSMITPSREQDFYSWARNMEAAKIVNQSIRRNNLSIEYDPNDPYFQYMRDAAPVDAAPQTIPPQTTVLPQRR